VTALSFDQFIQRLRALWRVNIPDSVNPHLSLYDDLAVDSFQAFELLIIIEGIAEIMMPPPEIPELFTLADTFEYYQTLRKIEMADS
jgi:acyl carrier protein